MERGWTVAAVYQRGYNRHLISRKLARELCPFPLLQENDERLAGLSISLIWVHQQLKYQYQTWHRVGDAEWGGFDVLFGDPQDRELQDSQPSPFNEALVQNILDITSPLEGVTPLRGQQGGSSLSIEPLALGTYNPDNEQSQGRIPPRTPMLDCPATDKPSTPQDPGLGLQQGGSRGTDPLPWDQPANSDTSVEARQTTSPDKPNFPSPPQAASPFPEALVSDTITHGMDPKICQDGVLDSHDMELDFSEAYWTWNSNEENWYHEDSDGETVWYPAEFD
ncbi:hypothetical protein MKZ38_008674 [Zalerion maritima]|uniref:Uncharacterized protein n=1 Tax=Zalerion maritima TaxID=339359 RepID=A0AAD5WMD4_9PEZI|nr:hypothetical protein MKZ38_008674 [Zalerion maritima]